MFTESKTPWETVRAGTRRVADGGRWKGNEITLSLCPGKEQKRQFEVMIPQRQRGRKRMQQRIRDLGQKRDTESRIAGIKRCQSAVCWVLLSWKLNK